ncbi:hypothetical protein [Hafnia paralvei]|uniref:hypothetical protein n=1 Tax=Hafnia paralvei TaxID=546367 RepID=UPI000BB535EE|nr:hypothetical protein [Hafnia paralvei]PNK67524.1 hypothetical protein A6J69_010980 [Hafnia paralvei]PNK67770.1 hypothetical protein A6J69_012300 [Hafnia paralvei]
MSLAELTFDCSSVSIEGLRYGSTRVVADSVDVDDLITQIKSDGAVDEALEIIGETDVIKWLEERGYSVKAEDDAA